MRVWLVRHGAPAAAPGVAVGWSDPGLDPTGWRQAEALARKLELSPVGRVYSSDLARARQTAGAIASRLGLPVEVTPDLRELDFGTWEGRRLAELWTESAAEAAAWESDLRRLPAGFGETFARFEARVLRFARTLPAGGDTAVAVVAHRGSLALLHAHLLGTSLEEAWKLPFALGCAVALEAP